SKAGATAPASRVIRSGASASSAWIACVSIAVTASGRPGQELVRELRLDAVVDGVGEDEDLVEDVVERLDVGLPVLLEPGDRLVLGQLQVEREEVQDVLLGPVRVRAGEEARDLAGVVGPALVVLRELGVVALLRGGDEIDRDHDVFLEEPGQRVAGTLAVVRDDGSADVVLVPEQSLGGGAGLRAVIDRGDDVLAGPDHVIRPELPQRDADGFDVRGHPDLPCWFPRHYLELTPTIITEGSQGRQLY